MIDFNGWPLPVQLVFLIGPLATGLLGVAIKLQVACTHEFHIMLGVIKSSPWLEQQKRSWGTSSVRSRWMLVCCVCGLLLFAGLHIRKGLLDADELRHFPAKLKRKLLISSWLTVAGSAWMVTSFILVKLSKA
ncbi:hypothetical protein NJF44_21655 [Pseudomonas guariconensis]|uniref:hypothetical protein n=1 Tax=Pseudomonas TaxID=286 RepID=UPI001CE3C33A|nr:MULTISPECIES: hypothetical protein [Pseudomonas]MCO7642941.1 hypothetical protein [Pseudomonas sp. S 311-6]MCU7222032.1 hypothetical protein [Pseudomonas brassicacearum]MCO7517707.1 hypothetical protein [Pseudomonas putida]MCO7567603.1 hypothetical protein [Pseudomonas mosselii]MCO7594579.1 hypothetical protein [Pseudomonas guariconensis]